MKKKNVCKVFSTVPETKNASYDDDNEEGDGGICSPVPGNGETEMTKVWLLSSKGLMV